MRHSNRAGVYSTTPIRAIALEMTSKIA
jgi:hypothetical protein